MNSNPNRLTIMEEQKEVAIRSNKSANVRAARDANLNFFPAISSSFIVGKFLYIQKTRLLLNYV